VLEAGDGIDLRLAAAQNPGRDFVVTLPGAVLPGPFPIAARKTYGHTSDGMIASARELGLGEEHDGILRLAALGLDDAPVGADAIHLLGLDDAAIEINVTPDRGYAFSIRGVAREYSHSTGAAFRDPALAVTVTPGTGFEVTIDDRAPIRGTVGSRVHHARRAWGRRDATDAAVDGGAPVVGRDAIHLAAGRHHQLRDDRDGPADARLGPRPAHRPAGRAPGAGGGEARDPRRFRART